MAWRGGWGVGVSVGGRGGGGDEWVPMGCGIWGRMDDQTWTYGTGMGEYGAQGWMGSHKIWDLGSGGRKMELWVTGMYGVLWDVGFGVGWPLKWTYGVGVDDGPPLYFWGVSGGGFGGAAV